MYILEPLTIQVKYLNHYFYFSNFPHLLHQYFAASNEVLFDENLMKNVKFLFAPEKNNAVLKHKEHL